MKEEIRKINSKESFRESGKKTAMLDIVRIPKKPPLSKPSFSQKKIESRRPLRVEKHPGWQNFKKNKEIKFFPKRTLRFPWKNFSLKDLIFCGKYSDIFFARKSLVSFLLLAVFGFFSIWGMVFLNRGLAIREKSFVKGEEAMASLFEAKENISGRNFEAASSNFEKALLDFEAISNDLESFGSLTVEISRYLPFASKLSSGANLAEIGKNMSRSGVLLGEILESAEKIKNPLEGEGGVSYLEIFENYDKNIREIAKLMLDTERRAQKINLEDLPEEKRVEFSEIKKRLPEINRFLSDYTKNSKIFSDLLGGNGQRKFLFLFQNNQEMRATGGFIGTYAILEITDGKVKNFFVDGIFNPDGQLREWTVPPGPIQKISVNWSLHDSNWFPDFPVSAEKAAWFYEKTGGPTVDGVITMTPEVLKKLLEVTGPVEMAEYGVTIDKDNFLETIQYEVEVDYDKEINQPKKILSDLAPEILNRIFNAEKLTDIAKTMAILAGSLDEKQILIYSKNWEIEKIIGEKGWSGEVLETQKDYLSVINTNINGFKTDGVVKEKISLKSEVQDDGSIINTVKIKREHTGGDSEYDWWNRVNSDYMRVYVPKDSRLISVSGHTREFNQPPVDYDALSYKRDPQVRMEEERTVVDEESGTKIYEDAGKTVFANWVYVSPRETAEITYKYLLPFKIGPMSEFRPIDTHSILFQKQSGSQGSLLEYEIEFPDKFKPTWSYPGEKLDFAEDLPSGKKSFKLDTDLKTDKFFGAAFSY